MKTVIFLIALTGLFPLLGSKDNDRENDSSVTTSEEYSGIYYNKDSNPISGINTGAEDDLTITCSYTYDGHSSIDTDYAPDGTFVTYISCDGLATLACYTTYWVQASGPCSTEPPGTNLHHISINGNIINVDALISTQTTGNIVTRAYRSR